MDAESLNQVEKIVITAVKGVEGRLRKDFNEKFEEAERHTDEKFEQAAQQSEALHEEALRHTDEKFEEAERHSGVLFEEMGRRLDLVIEGFEGLRQGQAALRQMIEHESLELQSLIKLSYRQLQERVETLEQRVQIIEKRLGLSN